MRALLLLLVLAGCAEYPNVSLGQPDAGEPPPTALCVTNAVCIEYLGSGAFCCHAGPPPIGSAGWCHAAGVPCHG